MLAAAILLGVIVVCQLIALAWITAAQADNMLELADMQQQERAEHRSELADLLQRIQAPEAAIVQHQIATAASPDRPAPAYDDDAGFWESKEDMAARIANEQ